MGKVKREIYLFRVPQGSILGPLLFLKHISDLQRQIQKSDIIMYADDPVLSFSDKNEIEIDKAINHDAELLKNWLLKNGLILTPNNGKAEFMLLGTVVKGNKTTHQVQINIGSKNINNTESCKYFEVYLNVSLKLNNHIVKICKKSSGRLGLLRKIRPILITYATMVQPVLTYYSIAFI